METESFVKYLQQTNRLESIQHINADGTPNMKHKYIRNMYHQYLYQSTPAFECSICMEPISDSICKLKCKHCFCVDCFSNLARTSNQCALCRQNISEDKVSKQVDSNVLVDVVSHELEASYSERDNMNLCEFIQNKVRNLYEKNKSERLLNDTTHEIIMEVFDSLHSVAYSTMDAIQDA